MLKSMVTTTFCAAAILAAAVLAAAVLAAVPANAQDDIEAKVQTCAVCHGANGEPLDPKSMPIIWGQQSAFLFKQLHDFRSGDRESAIMTPTAKGLAQDDLRKISA